MKQYKGFSIALILEIVFLVVISVSMIGPKHSVTLGQQDINIYDDSVTFVEEKQAFTITDNDETTGERDILGSNQFTLPKGVYEMKVTYASNQDGIGGNVDNSGGVVRLQSYRNPAGLVWTDLKLTDAKTEVSERVWVRSFGKVPDVEAKVHFWGSGTLEIKSIEFTEIMMGRFMRIIEWLVLFALIDIFYYYFFTKNQFQKKKQVAVLLGTICLASLPLSTNFLFSVGNQDLMFHLNRIAALAESIGNGHWNMPIQTEMLNGYGYATPLFYSQLFLYIPAILYNLTLPLQTCYQIYVLLVTIATCLFTYFAAKKMVKNDNLALLASFLYTMSAYRLGNVYVRAALGEYTAMAFFPLLVWGFYNIYTAKKGEKISLKSYLPIIIGLSGLLQCHLLSCELSAVFIVLVCVLQIKKTIEWQRFFALAKAAVLTVVLNLFYLVPFFASMQMNVQIAQPSGNKIQAQGTYWLQVLGIFYTPNGSSADGMHDEMPLALGFALVLGIGLFLYAYGNRMSWNLKDHRNFKTGVWCTVFAIGSMVLSTRMFPWDSLEDLSPLLSSFMSMIQFPWRYLAMATIFGSFATVIALQFFMEQKGKTVVSIAGGILVAFTICSAGLFYMEFGDSVDEYKMLSANDVNQMDVGAGEYLLAGTNKDAYKYRNITMDETVMEMTDYSYENGVTTFNCKNNAKVDSYIELPLISYDNYHAYAKDTELQILTGENNRLFLVIPASYSGNVKVVYEIPVVWYIMDVISLVAALVLIVCLNLPAGKCWKAVREKS